jgi:hypothetical protein
MYVAVVPECRRVSPGAELSSFTPVTETSFLSALVCEQRKNKFVNVRKLTLTSQLIRISVCLVARSVMIVGDNFEGSVHVVDLFCGSCLAVLSVSHIIPLSRM